ncbi:hypothetical protein BJX61DRAFT_537367 [Aspergillus egyptiacus]|nr:hypothetical protein BJX61DRAFT_537367 [Aspergillus egyptiacus]
MPPGVQSPFYFPVCDRSSPVDLNICSRSTSPDSLRSIVSPQEAKLQECDDQGRYSPRAVVAGRLGELAIRTRGPDDSQSQAPDRSLHQTSVLPILQANCFPGLHTDIHGFHDMPELQISETKIERSRSPDDQEPPTSGSAVKAEPQPQPTESPVKSSRQASRSPRKKRNAPASVKSRKATGSPPPTNDVEDLLTWNDSEITGHMPTDPDDDGYGINGIGFKPTAAIAWARSQKRQKQVAEWRHREAREAREKRRERREGSSDLDKLRTVQSGAIHKRVKFDL